MSPFCSNPPAPFAKPLKKGADKSRLQSPVDLLMKRRRKRRAAHWLFYKQSWIQGVQKFFKYTNVFLFWNSGFKIWSDVVVDLDESFLVMKHPVSAVSTAHLQFPLVTEWHAAWKRRQRKKVPRIRLPPGPLAPPLPGIDNSTKTYQVRTWAITDWIVFPRAVFKTNI